MSNGAPQRTEAELRQIEDGDVLLALPNGLFFARRQKHEWKPFLTPLQGKQLVRATDHIRGSKFVASWTLNLYVSWLQQQVAGLGWDRDTAAGEHLVEFDQVIGISAGKPAHMIRIEISSGCVHAYPVLE